MASYEEWDIAGYRYDDEWFDVQAGDQPLESGSPDIELVDELVIQFTDEAGEDHYYTIYGPWDDWDELYGEIDDLGDAYAGEMA